MYRAVNFCRGVEGRAKKVVTSIIDTDCASNCSFHQQIDNMNSSG